MVLYSRKSKTFRINLLECTKKSFDELNATVYSRECAFCLVGNLSHCLDMDSKLRNDIHYICLCLCYDELRLVLCYHLLNYL